ncbi:MAG: SRPBCC family protein [Ilumatobacteraceae bacterium]
MPIVEHSAWAAATVTDAFDLSMSHARRFDWDPFVKAQRFLDGARRPAVGVRTWTKDRRGLVMVTRYLTFQRPHRVGMKMEEGPPFFRTFSGAWRFEERDDGCDVHFRYNFTCRPRLLAPLMERVGVWYLGRDIRRRVETFAAALTNGMRADGDEAHDGDEPHWCR